MNDPIFAWKVLSTLRLRPYREIFPYPSLLFAIRPKKQIDVFLTYPYKGIVRSRGSKSHFGLL